MSRRAAAKSFRLQGFNFGKGIIFGTEDDLERIHLAVAGPWTESELEKLKETSAEAITNLFRLLLKKREVYRLLRNTPYFWHEISVNWDILKELGRVDVQSIAEKFIAARRAFLNNKRNLTSNINKRTHLTVAVDAFLPTYEAIEAMGDDQPSFRHPITPDMVETTTKNLEDLSLSTRAYRWPPTHLNIKEIAWITDDHIGPQLTEYLPNIPHMPYEAHEFPLMPNNSFYPRDVKLWLAFCGVTRYSPPWSKFAVFMLPIGFQNARERQDWYKDTGGLSKQHATILEFLDYAEHMIDNEGRDLVLGMVTYWTDGENAFANLYEEQKKENETRGQFWASNCMRHAIGVAIVKLPLNKGYRLMIYDMDHWTLKTYPFPEAGTDDENINELCRCMRDWRAVVVELADKVFEDDLINVWTGGRAPTVLEKEYDMKPRDNDSVSHTAAWIWDMLHGRYPGTAATPQALKDWSYEFWALEDAESGPEEDADEKPKKKKTVPKKNRRAPKTATKKAAPKKAAPKQPVEEPVEEPVTTETESVEDNDRSSDEDFQLD